ncbi:hypothetical protein [Streptomyces thermoviolaceus]|uniref:hypothetical protein n=1 Tax=Streptomyces thermoviolaceus TaxID=1952 RepID=UPI0016773593|nr:hypothetical protein [Streptomyces thermoviolaceus]GGV80541.1 hypothetical protein GCM10010499_43680 [Streptomyces thermoviolaceus subsp. apingens]
MSGKRTLPSDALALAAGRAAGYCWVRHPTAPAWCTQPSGHDGPHVDHYNGRQPATDTEGYRWPQG